MILLAIDPGNVQSAYVIYDTDTEDILEKDILINELLMSKFSELPHIDMAIIERIASYGMSVGESIFETVFFSGKFAQKLEDLGIKVDRIKRIDIKNILCHSSRAKDAQIRQVLIDRFGAPGTKKNQGKTYGFKADMWAALAVAVAYSDRFVTFKDLV